MNLKIKSKNKKGELGLKEMMFQSKGRINRSFYKVSIFEESPFTVNFELTKLSNVIANNQTIKNTVITALYEQLETEHNLTNEDIEVSF
jgi:hypothetical protein